MFARPLKYKGKIIYNSETGEPIHKKDSDAFIKAAEAFLNSNTGGASKQMTLDTVTSQKLLSRMAKYHTTHFMHNLITDSLRYKNKSFDWIRQEYQHLTDVLGEPLSRAAKGRYQVCEDYARTLITKINDDVLDGIKETLLEGTLQKRSKTQVSQNLFNRFGQLNRNWRRIADTDIANTANLASILEEVHSAAEGEKVYLIRHEMGSACAHCRKTDGIIALWAQTPLENDRIKDQYASIGLWDGKKKQY